MKLVWLGTLFCRLWSLVLLPHSAPLSRGGASIRPSVQPAVHLTNGRGGLRLAELAFAAGQAALHDQATHHTGLDLLKVICLSPDLRLQEVDVCLIPSLLLREGRDRKANHFNVLWVLCNIQLNLGINMNGDAYKENIML